MCEEISLVNTDVLTIRVKNSLESVERQPNRYLSLCDVYSNVTKNYNCRLLVKPYYRHKFTIIVSEIYCLTGQVKIKTSN